MKTFSLAGVSSVLLFGSSIASADPRFGPEPFRDFDRYPHHHHHGRPFVAPVSPLARILPRVVVPAPVIVTPRREIPVTRPSHSPVVTVPSTPTPAPVPATPQPTTNPKPNKPQPPSGQGNGGNKPPKPAR